VPAAEAGITFVPRIGPSLAETLCVQTGRIVAKDNTVRYQGRSLQIPQDLHRFHYVKVTVRVHEYPDGTLTVFHGSRCLAQYRPDGRLIEPGCAQPSRGGPTHGSAAPPILHPRPTVRDTISARG
jgi:hypothetical protein